MTGENVGHPEGSNVRGGPSMGGGLAPPPGPTRTAGGVRVASTQLQGWSRDAGPAGPPPLDARSQPRGPARAGRVAQAAPGGPSN